MKYQHLFFDLDHTIWDFETNAKESLQDLYTTHNLAAKGVDSFDHFFDHYSAHNQRLWDRYTKGFIKQEELKWKRMWLALLEYKIADETLSRQMSLDFLEILPTKKTLFEGTTELLTYLQGKGYQMHLVTNGFENVQHQKIKYAGLSHYFGAVITSEASNSLKPNKEIFDYAFAKTGATATNSIMIGDNQDADIKGGINAGMDTIFVNHIGATPHVKATHEVFDLPSIAKLL
jgi:putative hydrolase of the HAD superfamily